MRRLLVTINADGDGCDNCEHVVDVRFTTARCALFGVGLRRRQDGVFERVTGCLNAERLVDATGRHLVALAEAARAAMLAGEGEESEAAA